MSLLFALSTLVVVACGGSEASEPDGGSPTARNSVTPTTPVPAPPWATGTVAQTEPATPPTPISATTPPTAVPTVPATPTAAPTQSPPTATSAPPTPTAAPQFPTAVTIGIQDDIRFAPNRTTIAAGGSVTFAWSGDVFHNVSSATGGFSSDLVKSGSFTFTLNAPGSYSYLCEVHTATMRGVIEVK